MKKYVKKEWRGNLIYCFYTFMFAGLFSASSVTLTFVLDGLVALDMTKMFSWLGINYLLMLGAYVFVYLRYNYQEKLLQRTLLDLKGDVLVKIEKMNYQDFHTKDPSDYAAWLSTDISIIEEQGFKKFYTLIYHGALVITSTISLLYYHYSLIILSLIIATLIITAPRFFADKMKKRSITVSKKNETALTNVVQLLKGFDILFSFKKQFLLNKLSAPPFQEIAQSKVKQTKTTRKMYFVLQLLQSLGELSVIGLTGVLVVLKKQLLGVYFQLLIW